MKFNKKLHIAVIKAGELLAANLPDENSLTISFSSDFEDRMNTMIGEFFRKRVRRKKIKKVTVVAFVTAVLIFSIVFAAIPEVRAAISGWITSIEDMFNAYRHEGPDSSSKDMNFEMGWIPDGYEEIWRAESDLSKHVIYEKGNKQLSFSYAIGDNGAAVFVDTTNAIIKHMTINGHTGDLYISKSEQVDNTIVWNDTVNDVVFYINAFADEKDMVKMAESVE